MVVGVAWGGSGGGRWLAVSGWWAVDGGWWMVGGGGVAGGLVSICVDYLLDPVFVFSFFGVRNIHSNFRHSYFRRSSFGRAYYRRSNFRRSKF